jgi:hypothetical protein
MVKRAGVLDRTNVDDLSDSLPLQDFTASMLMLEERFSKLEVCVCVCVCVCARGACAQWGGMPLSSPPIVACRA